MLVSQSNLWQGDSRPLGSSLVRSLALVRPCLEFSFLTTFLSSIFIDLRLLKPLSKKKYLYPSTDKRPCQCARPVLILSNSQHPPPLLLSQVYFSTMCWSRCRAGCPPLSEVPSMPSLWEACWLLWRTGECALEQDAEAAVPGSLSKGSQWHVIQCRVILLFHRLGQLTQSNQWQWQSRPSRSIIVRFSFWRCLGFFLVRAHVSFSQISYSLAIIILSFTLAVWDIHLE